jgi:N4-gp56 family major capsid protein
MSEMTWTEIKGTGILANHQLSKKLLEKVLGATVVLPFTRDYGIGVKRNAGEIVNIMRVEPLPQTGNARLEEESGFPISKLAWANRALTLRAYGKGVEYSDLMEHLSAFKPSDVVQRELKKQMEGELDTEAAVAFMDPTAALIVYSPTSLTGGTLSVNGTPGATATAGLTYDHCRYISAYMRDTIHVPYFEGDHFIGLSSNKNIESLLDDGNIQEWHKYLQKGDYLYKGEMGMVARIRWVEVNRSQAFSNTAGASTTLGEGVVFGDEAVARLEVLTPHLRLDPNFQSRFGTRQAAAWYGILAMGSVHNVADDGWAKIMRLDSL